MLLRIVLVFALLGVGSGSRFPGLLPVGVARRTIIDMIHADTMPTLVWFPTTDSARPTTLMLQDVDIAPGGRYSAGKTEVSATQPATIPSVSATMREALRWLVSHFSQLGGSV